MVNIFEDHPRQIESVLESLLELISTMFKDKCLEICSFASTCYRLLFNISKCNKQLVIGQLISFICEKAIPGPFNHHCDFKTNSLRILNLIRNTDHVWDLMGNLPQLLKMLDYTNNDLSMPQFRMMMEFFCAMAYSPRNNTLENPQHIEMNQTLKEHLDMMLKKQLGSSVIK